MNLIRRLALNYVRIRFALLSMLSKRKAAEKALDIFRTPQRTNNKPASEIFNEAEKMEFELEGVQIRGYRWNQHSDRKVLIIHGFESSILNFDHYVRPLINKGYEVLVFDAPAHGISDGKTITTPLFAKMITTIHEKYGPVQSFIAHSFGGLALSIALENIEHNETYRVVLIAPATETKTAVDQFFDLLKLNGEVRTEFDKLIAELGGHPVEWYSIRRAMKHIKARVLWLHDDDDKQTPIVDALKVKQENFPNVNFVITKGLGHSKIYRDPEIVKKILEFI